MKNIPFKYYPNFIGVIHKVRKNNTEAHVLLQCYSNICV
jgi:hypothetical protein